MSQLDQLAQHRDAILLAEAIGWLHDYRKCSEEQLQAQSANTTAQGIARNELTNRFSALDSASLKVSSVTERLPDLLNQWSGQAEVAGAPFLRQYLSRCHNTAHFDKQEPYDSGKQTYPGSQISTAFGFEKAVAANLTNQLWSLPWNSLPAYSMNDRNALLAAVQSLFATVGADTRRPINEVSLWDWGLLVGSLYKTAIAAAILGQQPPTSDLRWRLLGVRTDALTYFTSVSRLPDLVARQSILQTAISNVQTILETVYPLAVEVYRDENGSLYVAPDFPNLLHLQDGSNQTLLSHIREQFATDGDVVPEITLDSTAWWGQDPDRNGNDEIPPAGAILSSPTVLQSDPIRISDAWRGETEQICPICSLRPCISSQTDYCQICGDRRKGRVTEWFKDQSKTIWLDEVADGNGRLALIIGTFNLTNWLDGTLVQTMLVREPTASALPVAKTASFARLRRVWRTTQTFWQESQAAINQTLSDARRRLKIRLANTPNLTANQTYELDLRGQTRMSVLWDGEHLISIDNLSYTAVQLGVKATERRTPADAALSVGAWLEGCKGSPLQLISDDEKNRRFDIQIADIDYQDAAYSTAIPILAEPRTFLALFPADKALDVIDAIRAKYAREMGKVRNRLPLHLGAVYFHRRTPLRAALDAGRRMLKYELGSLQEEVWTVEAFSVEGREAAPQALAKDTSHFDETVAVTLAQNGRSLTWHVPNRMGDGTTPDHWYPYVFIRSDVTGRQRIFKGLRPTGDGNTEACWLIHAAELKEGDQVYFTPATLDFQWLDSAGERFAIAYDAQGRRQGSLTRPYLLDDLETIQRVWKIISEKTGLTSSQIYALRDLIEAKRETWQEDETFAQLCCDAVRNARWKERRAVDLKLITDAAISGLLTDVIQLYMGILKAKPQREDENNE